MGQSFDSVITDPQNQVFHVVFFPDRIYHAQYLNATRSHRYRYNVREVRGKADMNVLKGEVYLDGARLANFIRLEYRASRLTEVVRERGRFIGSKVVARVGVLPPGQPDLADRYVWADVTLTYCAWIDAYQVEIWDAMEPPAGATHDWQVLDQMGWGGSITHVPAFAPYMQDLRALRNLRVALREAARTEPSGYVIDVPAWDNFYERNVQVPNSGEPNSPNNTVIENTYTINFQRGWYIRDIGDIDPVRYRDALMDERHPLKGQDPDNIVDMRWILQQEFGSTLVFFHEVHLRPGVVEGTHQHVGSEELYCITEGEGIAYMSVNDDPDLPQQLQALGLPSEPVEQDVFGVGRKPCYAVPVRKGSIIFTKSGGVHGIRNNGDTDLRFLAFLYHSS